MILKDMYLGTSIAISWAWGTSLILGMQIARDKGLGSFLIWAVANCLTLAVFGFLYKKRYIYPEVLNTTIVQLFTAIIQLFCLIIQFKILYEALITFLDPVYSYVLTAGVTIGLFLWMKAKGLKASIFSDLFQGIITIIALLFMVGYAFHTQIPSPIVSSSGSDILWGMWSACILLSGIMTDLQHWQRAEVNGKGYAFEWATFFFALYLGLVGTLSLFNFDSILNIALIITVLAVTTSTIDSIAVAMFQSFGHHLGMLLGFFITLFCGVFIYQFNVLSLWSYFGIIRVGLALYILYFCYKNRHVLR